VSRTVRFTLLLWCFVQGEQLPEEEDAAEAAEAEGAADAAEAEDAGDAAAGDGGAAALNIGDSAGLKDAVSKLKQKIEVTAMPLHPAAPVTYCNRRPQTLVTVQQM
jgi:hypothetical protein